MPLQRPARPEGTVAPTTGAFYNAETLARPALPQPPDPEPEPEPDQP